MTLNRPAHPLDSEAIDTSNNGLGHVLNDILHMDLPATVPPTGPRTTMRPVADDYQHMQKGVPTHGYDNDIPTADWQPDQEYACARDVVPPIPAPKPIPAVDVRVISTGPLYTQIRRVFGASELYSSTAALNTVDRTTIRQILPYDPLRYRADIRVTGNYIGSSVQAYYFAVSAFKDFPDGEWTIVDLSTPLRDIFSTNEMWAALFPLLAYDSTKLNSVSMSLVIQSYNDSEGNQA